MTDLASIEVAFATAQRAIGGIKQAVAMGKDIKSLYVQFGTFFENSDKIHTAHCLGEIKGMTNGQIAEQLFLSNHTINTHRKNIMGKLGVKNTAGIVMYAVKTNLVSPNKFLFAADNN
jgi:hypothetical protein